jgi:sortase A
MATYSYEKGTVIKRGYGFLRFVQEILVIAGTLTLCYVAGTLLYARFYQNAANNSLEQQINTREVHKANLPRPVFNEGDVVGRIVIPRLKVKVAVLEGTSTQTLQLGVGHIEGTALPGESGNIGIAGHRDTFFRALKNIRKDDEIQLQTAAGVDKYTVDWIQITAPDDGGIVSNTKDSSLTLVTCYPFYYIGASPERYVVHAHKIV